MNSCKSLDAISNAMKLSKVLMRQSSELADMFTGCLIGHPTEQTFNVLQETLSDAAYSVKHLQKYFEDIEEEGVVKPIGKLVSMILTNKDVVNAEKLKEKFHTRNKAEAVSAALSITVSLMDRLANGEQFYTLTKSGKTEFLIIEGLI